MESLDELLDGNRRSRARFDPSGLLRTRAPIAAVLSCTDERVVPQEIFDQPPGKLYMVRMAGNVVTPEVAGSLELAVLRLGCPLVLVLGHTDCTAVQMAGHSDWYEGSSFEISRRIRDAIQDLPPSATLTDAVSRNTLQATRELLSRSRALRERTEAGSLKIGAALYDLATGGVRML